jgi:hypothetical protein
MRNRGLKDAMIEYLRQRGGQATTLEIHRAMEERFGRKVASSSVRGGLQNERYFERVRRGEFKLRPGV